MTGYTANNVACAREATNVELTVSLLPCVSNAAIRRTAHKIAYAIASEARYFTDEDGLKTPLYQRAIDSAAALASGDPTHLILKIDAVQRLVKAARADVDARAR